MLPYQAIRGERNAGMLIRVPYSINGIEVERVCTYLGRGEYRIDDYYPDGHLVHVIRSGIDTFDWFVALQLLEEVFSNV